MLQPITMKICEQYADMFEQDLLLKQEGIAPATKMMPADIYDYFLSWERKNNAECFAIIVNGVVVGSISLSHITINDHSAQIGYWIGSAFRKRGYAAQAFDQILDYAKTKSIRCFCAHIHPDNTASLRLWEKKGAVFTNTACHESMLTVVLTV